MSTGKKSSFACEFTIHFNVKYQVALDLLESNNNLSASSILWSQAFFPLKCTSLFKHPLFQFLFYRSQYPYPCLYVLPHLLYLENGFQTCEKSSGISWQTSQCYIPDYLRHLSPTNQRLVCVQSYSWLRILWAIAHFRPLDLSVEPKMLIHTSTHLKLLCSHGLLQWRVSYFGVWLFDTNPNFGRYWNFCYPFIDVRTDKNAY